VYLVDTNVISAAALSRPEVPALVEWMDAHSASLFLSVVTIAEIEDGIAKSRRQRTTRKSANFAAWLETVLHLYSDRILAFDVPTARIAGMMRIARAAKAKHRDWPISSLPLRRRVTG
jgi:toxin FitB